ncbi:protein gp37 [Ancylobacter sp. 3268]|uniref:DUF5131 family protein n=1 Tax=Ancylobacter sp. 3268 TaxID=2817752 RepID=UPI002863B33F|nr:DUF5131 family protein [Ancylobacter sp. 3268]MDR6953837.1 protein gp37 [Ancylobacter sp. 3268]
MADRSSIEWTDATWNPVRARSLLKTGGIGWHCEKVSDGCRNCYAEPMNVDRFGTGLAYKPGNAGKVEIYLDEAVLARPLHWRRPRKIFPGSMTDLFGDWVTDAMLDRIFAVMLLAPQHVYQLLTKRPERMRAYIGMPGEARAARNDAIRTAMEDLSPGHGKPWALQPRNPNIWLGISAEDQRTYDDRSASILDLAGGFPLFVSAEPLLGPIDLRFNWDHCDLCGGTGMLARWPRGKCHVCGGKGQVLINGQPNGKGYRAFSWIIAGGESGPRARPMHPAGPISLRDQCASAGVAFLFKQWGEWIDADQWVRLLHVDGFRFTHLGKPVDLNAPLSFELAAALAQEIGARFEYRSDGGTFFRIGKRRAGRLLDGIEHNAFPEIRP